MSRSDARKPESDLLPYISVNTLNQEGLFRYGHSLKITTTLSNRDDNVVTVGVTMGYEPQVVLNFYIDQHIGQRQVVHLTETKCNFGGVRQWFKCPLCNKRVGKLFLLRGKYACRHCYDLTYKSRIRNTRSGLYSLFTRYEKDQKAKEMLANTRSLTYRGKPTKRFRKILELTDYGTED